jgi:sulfoxide reductase catalytic subunit YedY
MLIGKSKNIPSSEITPEKMYVNRREFIGKSATIGAGASLGWRDVGFGDLAERRHFQKDWSKVRSELDEELTPFGDVTSYNNFYEFGTGKSDPARNSHSLKPRPWTIEVGGLCDNPGTYDLEDFIKPGKVEDRVYRMRCVEAWSMVIPWQGFSLKDVIDRAKPSGSARFVEFQTLNDVEQMPGQRYSVLRWPYIEGLRLDEAQHPLAMLVTGVYGTALPNQNGAPIRLIVPWKYGFKGIKSIVSMRFLEQMPTNTWKRSASQEYGFYANVNPDVPHPRWSQARERRIGEFRRRPTLMFNGYADEVASLYSGMDLRIHY